MFININGAQINTTATGEDVVTVVQNTTNLNQLHDVSTNGVGNNHVLQYNSLASEWQSSADLTVDGDLTAEFIKNPTSIELSVDGQDKLTINGSLTVHKQLWRQVSVSLFETNNPAYSGYNTNPFNITAIFRHYSDDGDSYHSLMRKELNLTAHTVDIDSSLAELFAATDLNGDTRNIGELQYTYKTDYLHEYRIGLESQYEGGNFTKDVMTASVKGAATTVPWKFAEIDSGTTLPGSPDDGRQFFHDTGTANIMKIYSNGSWWDFDPENGSVFYDNNRGKLLLKTSSGYVSFDTTAI